jgi:hypothetical protein
MRDHMSWFLRHVLGRWLRINSIFQVSAFGNFYTPLTVHIPSQGGYLSQDSMLLTRCHSREQKQIEYISQQTSYWSICLLVLVTYG